MSPALGHVVARARASREHEFESESTCVFSYCLSVDLWFVFRGTQKCKASVSPAGLPLWVFFS